MNKNNKPMKRLLSLLLLLLTIGSACSCNRCPDISLMKVDAKGNISWDDAQKIILGCDVQAVTQNHAREVSIIRKDGTTFRTIEPNIDDVGKLIKKHGLKDKIDYATEKPNSSRE